MDIKQQDTVLGNFVDGRPMLTLHNNPYITKKRDIPRSSRPKMYLKVQELLSQVATDFASEIIEGR
jgi:hypothetical protein